MSGLFGTLGVAKSALFASQLVLQTTANNVANAGRPAYSRQRVDLTASLPETLPVGQVGTGVTVAGIRRLRDQFLDQQFSKAQQALGEHEATQSTLTQIETLLGEPSDTGLQASLSQFFTSLRDVASYPEDSTTRRAALEQGGILASNLQRVSAGLTDLKRNIESEITGRISEANDLLQEVGHLNSQIQTVVVAGGSPNDLLDRRDEAVDELSKMLSLVRVQHSDGTIQLSLSGGGGVLVDGTTVANLGAQLSATSDDYQITLGGTVVGVTGGEIAGLLHSRNDTDGYVKYAQGRLDTLAGSLIEQMNKIQAAGAGSVGLQTVTSQYAVTDPTMALSSAGLPFGLTVPGSFNVFVYDQTTDTVTGSGTISLTGATTLNDLATQFNSITGLSASVSGGTLTLATAAGSAFRFAGDTSNALPALGLNAFFTGSDARTIAVNPDLVADPRLLSTGIPDSTTGLVAAGDNQAVLAMAGLSEQKVLGGGAASFTDYYAESVGVLGARASAANQLVESQTLVTQTIQNQREQVAGVSLDEEMIELTKAQRAFEASAKLIAVVDELLDTVVNGLKR
jgi:flagellar hook-associated protein 1 FlgK